MKRYLLYVSVPYAYSILRPLQDEIKRRGDDVAWFFEKQEDSKYLLSVEKQMKSLREVVEYNPFAVFAPANYVYDFIPGIKVQLFHGLIRKRPDSDSHFRIRGFFDLYCTVGGESTPRFKELEKEYGYFKVIETGWSKLDDMMPVEPRVIDKPVIFYSSTFSEKHTSTGYLFETIEELVKNKEWDWIVNFHPKMKEDIVLKYKELEKYDNFKFIDTVDTVSLMKRADVMLSDSSSIVAEFLWLNKPVVTFRNNNPGNYLIDVKEEYLVGEAIEKALTRPEELMGNIKAYIDWIHPYRDGKSSGRILDAVDVFDKEFKGKLKKKPLNLFRILKIRKQAHYFPFGPYYKRRNNNSEI